MHINSSGRIPLKCIITVTIIIIITRIRMKFDQRVELMVRGRGLAS